MDLFGYVAEEKEVTHIAGKLMEARANKSFDTFLIMAQYITDKCLVDLILPLKEVSETVILVNNLQLHN